MREKHTGYLGIEETLSTISIARRTLIPKIKKRAQWGPREKPSENRLSQRYFDEKSIYKAFMH
jgi:hypothetical protein